MPREHDCMVELDEWCNVCTEARLKAADSATTMLLDGWTLVRSSDRPWHWLRGRKIIPLSVDEVRWIEDR